MKTAVPRSRMPAPGPPELMPQGQEWGTLPGIRGAPPLDHHCVWCQGLEPECLCTPPLRACPRKQLLQCLFSASFHKRHFPRSEVPRRSPQACTASSWRKVSSASMQPVGCLGPQCPRLSISEQGPCFHHSLTKMSIFDGLLRTSEYSLQRGIEISTLWNWWQLFWHFLPSARLQRRHTHTHTLQSCVLGKTHQWTTVLNTGLFWKSRSVALLSSPGKTNTAMFLVFLTIFLSVLGNLGQRSYPEGWWFVLFLY